MNTGSGDGYAKLILTGLLTTVIGGVILAVVLSKLGIGDKPPERAADAGARKDPALGGGSVSKKEPAGPQLAPKDVPRPENPIYRADTGKLTVSNDPPEGWELGVCVRPDLDSSVFAWSAYGRTREADVGRGAARVWVEFIRADRKMTTGRIPAVITEP